MTNEKTYQDGDIFLANFTFVEGNESKIRPVVIFQNPETKELLACKVSTQIQKPIASKLGYELKDWKASGLKKACYVSCEKANMRTVDPNNLVRLIGKLSERDSKGLLIKHIVVMQRELEYEQHKAAALEKQIKEQAQVKNTGNSKENDKTPSLER